MLWGGYPERENACWSIQAPLYLSPNAGWASAEDDQRHRGWVDGALRNLAPLSRGVQFSDADLGARPGVDGLEPGKRIAGRGDPRRYDPERRFFPYMSPA